MLVQTWDNLREAQWSISANRPSEATRVQPASGSEAGDAGWRVWSKDLERQIKWPVVERLYDVADPARVCTFTFEKPYVLELLLDAYARLCALFGETSTIRLDFNVDPEIPGRRYLAVRVLTVFSVDEAIERMDHFDEVWWLDRIGRAGRDLLFALEFI